MQQLLEIMKTLREKCPWDQAQTPETLTRYAIEEAYEVEAAVRSGDAEHVKEELGDLLLQVVFQSQMYAEQGAFSFQDVVETLIEKLIRRHPHVFDENFAQLDEQQVSELWQNIKQQEKQNKAQTEVSVLDEVKHGPALSQAQQLQKYAARMRFDWDDVSGAFEKLDEEVAELKEAVLSKDQRHIEEELGDTLFSLVNVGRKLDKNCEMALLSTTHKFRTRFGYIEKQLHAKNLKAQECDLAYLDQLWDAAKREEKIRKNQ